MKYNISYHMYADDTQLYLDFKDSQENAAMSSIQSCIQDIKTWLTDNFLLLNDKKTEIVKVWKTVLQRRYPNRQYKHPYSALCYQPWMHTGRGVNHVYACDSSM